jgi:HAD superfamily hydrolase (TIGR01450 family)
MRAVLIDIDGVLTVSWKPLPGAVAALHRLRAAGVPLALATNTTSRTRASIASVLAEAGFPVTASDVLTAPVIAAAYLHDHYPGVRCLLLNSGDITEDLAGLTLAREDDQASADVVLIGGGGPEFSYQALNQAFGHLQRGTRNSCPETTETINEGRPGPSASAIRSRCGEGASVCTSPATLRLDPRHARAHPALPRRTPVAMPSAGDRHRCDWRSALTGRRAAGSTRPDDSGSSSA